MRACTHAYNGCLYRWQRTRSLTGPVTMITGIEFVSLSDSSWQLCALEDQKMTRGREPLELLYRSRVFLYGSITRKGSFAMQILIDLRSVIFLFRNKGKGKQKIIFQSFCSMKNRRRWRILIFDKCEKKSYESYETQREIGKYSVAFLGKIDDICNNRKFL